MKTTKRFEEAVTKLYNAFHEGTLDYGNCSHCAVGNIVGSRNWSDVIGCGNVPSMDFDEILKRHKKYGTDFHIGMGWIEKTGYSPKELFMVEGIFAESSLGVNRKDYQFKGLFEVVKYLCDLDGIPNVMDYTSLFETENNEPVKHLQF